MEKVPITRQQFDALRKSGLDLMAPTYGGDILFQKYEDLVLWSEDQDAWDAKWQGVTKEHYLAWLRFYNEHGQCTGTTKKGLRCRARSVQDSCCRPREFVPGVSDRCRAHGGRR